MGIDYLVAMQFTAYQTTKPNAGTQLDNVYQVMLIHTIPITATGGTTPTATATAVITTVIVIGTTTYRVPILFQIMG